MNYNDLPLYHFAKDVKKSLKKGRIKAVIFGNFGACNIGDEAILAGELEELRQVSTVQVSVVSRFPKNVKSIHKVNAISLFNPYTYIKMLLTTQVFIIGGGGLFCKNDSGIKGIFFQLYTVLLFLTIPAIFQKDIFILGLGFYPNTNKVITSVALLFFKYAKIVTVRDHVSHQFLRSRKVKVKEFKDNSYLLPIAEKNAFRLHPGSKSSTVGLALNRPHTPEGEERFRSEIVRFIAGNISQVHFAFYTLDYHPLYNNDRKFAKEIIRKVKKVIGNKDFSYELIPATFSPQLIFGSFTQCDFMITSRLHGSIFAHRLKVPFYGISYDEKCTSFLSSIGHSWITQNDVTAESIQQSFTKTVRKGADNLSYMQHIQL